MADSSKPRSLHTAKDDDHPLRNKLKTLRLLDDKIGAHGLPDRSCVEQNISGHHSLKSAIEQPTGLVRETAIGWLRSVASIASSKSWVVGSARDCPRSTYRSFTRP